MHWLLFLLFLLPIEVQAETYYTPYYETSSPTWNQTLEKIEEKEVYVLQKETKKTKKYYPLTQKIPGYHPIFEEYIDLPDSTYKTNCKKEANVTWKKKITYQKLKAIQEITIESHAEILIKDIAVYCKNQKIQIEVTSSFTRKKRIWKIHLQKKQNPEELEIEWTVFLRQEIEKASLLLYDNEKITLFTYPIHQKGFSKKRIQLTHEIRNYKMEKKKSVFFEDKQNPIPYFYIRIDKIETVCQEKERRYRFEQDQKTMESDTPIKEGYTLLKKETKTIYFRREKIVLKDTLITNSPYLLVDQLIESTSFPLKDLVLIHPVIEEEGFYPITFSYRDFEITKTVLYQKKVA